MADPYEDLVASLSNRYGLRIGHINVNGLKSKLSEISLLIHSAKLDILAITESHLSDKIPDTEINIEGYFLSRKDRDDGRKGGGTMIYYRESLNVLEHNMQCDFESCWLNILYSNQQLLLGCIYRSPNNNKFLTSFEKILNNICLRRKNILLLGDFNIDINDTNSAQTTKLRDIIYSHRLFNMIHDPTRITMTTSSTIDLILSSANSSGFNVTMSGTYDPGISDHHLIYAVTNIHRQKNLTKTITSHKIKNIEQLKHDFELVPWHILEIFDDVDDVQHLWYSLYAEILKDHTKTVKLKKRAKNKPWINKEIRKELNKRYKLLLDAKRTKNPDTWNAYKAQRNHCKRLLQASEANYWKETFGKTDSSKSFWKAVNMFQGKSKTSNTIGTITVDNVHFTESIDKANALNKHFSTIGENSQASSTNDDSHIYRVTPIAPDLHLDERTFEKAFNSAIKVGKAPGPDKIKPADMKAIGPISSGLYKVIKFSIEKNKFPTEWKTGKVTCLHKKGSKSNCNNPCSPGYHSEAQGGGEGDRNR